MTETLWETPNPELDRRIRFNGAHGHQPDCEFVVDGWLCAPLCEGIP